MKKFAALVAVLALVAFAAPAFAANPFMDVPMNHWAYDAVSQLASRGVVSGYPDGAFKGEWKATRYEMASVVARALAYVDMNKASKQDLELLKKLVVEFKDELDALGVKVDELDSRVAVLEDGVGGWKIGGEFRFDAKWTDLNASAVYGLSPQGTSDVDFSMSRYRIHLWKTIDDKVSFYGRINAAGGPNLNNNGLVWDKYQLTVLFPWDVTATIGRFVNYFETTPPYGEGVVTGNTRYGYRMVKDFSMGHFALVAQRGDQGAAAASTDDRYELAAQLHFNFNENFSANLNYLKHDFDSPAVADEGTWWIAAKVAFNPDISLEGVYYKQDMVANAGAGFRGDPSAWRAMLDISQNMLGFTSLWIEYADYDGGFNSYNGATYEFIAAGDTTFGRLANDLTVWDVYAVQKWNDKWNTFVRYAKFDYDDSGAGNARDLKNWAFGVKYFYTPALSFELAYDKYDHSNDALDDNLIRFRTYVSF